MTVHFCPHCGRLNRDDFVFCPWCGEAVATGPGLEDAMDLPFKRLEELGPKAGTPDGRMERSIDSLREMLDALEADMDDLIASRHESGDGRGAGETER